MPARTNDFQKLVELIQRLFSPKNAVVTESAMVETASGQKREVDVLVEFETDLYQFRVAIEAKDLSRPIETTTLEQYIGKYNSRDGIAVNKVIIVAKAFSQTVIERAQSLGFELHTLTSLETDGIGLFSKNPQETGGWWATRELGQNLKLSLFGNADQKLSDRYLKGKFMQSTPLLHLGTPLSWARSIVNGYLGEQINRLYEEHSGETIHPIVEIEFDDHIAEAKVFGPVRLRKMELDFGERMKFPQMQSQLSELKIAQSKTKIIARESGTGKNAKVNIVYEDAGENPSGVYLHTESLDKSEQIIRKVVLKFDSKEIDEETVRNLVSEASNSW